MWENYLPYKGDANLDRTKDILSAYDAIIWLNPCPTKNKINIGNTRWPELYCVVGKQIAIVCDGNYEKAYPWMYLVRSRLNGLACVHTCAYNSMKGVDVPRALIPSPQNTARASLGLPWSNRNKGWLSPQTFKRWKRVDDLLKAIPYMNPMTMRVAGTGIEWRYMNSVDKIKPEYVVDGEPIVTRAKRYGMEYLGVISAETRDSLLRETQFLIDSSWSLAYAKIGGHFNRTISEAVLQGAIPIARNLGVADNAEGNDRIYKAGENYIMIPHDATAEEFAECVNQASAMKNVDAEHMRRTTFEKIRRFTDRNSCVSQYVALLNGETFTTEFTTVETGAVSPHLEERAKVAFYLAFSEVRGV